MLVELIFPKAWEGRAGSQISEQTLISVQIGSRRYSRRCTKMCVLQRFLKQSYWLSIVYMWLGNFHLCSRANVSVIHSQVLKCLFTFVSRTERPCHLCDQLIFLVHQICQATDPTSYTSTLQIIFVALPWTLIFHVYYWSSWNNILGVCGGAFFKVREGYFSTSVFSFILVLQ